MGMIYKVRSREMLILIELHKNISVQTVACIVKHADPQINSVRGVFNKFAADVLYSCELVRLQIYSIEGNTESVKLFL